MRILSYIISGKEIWLPEGRFGKSTTKNIYTMLDPTAPLLGIYPKEITVKVCKACLFAKSLFQIVKS